jgi:hypothetical protein
VLLEDEKIHVPGGKCLKLARCLLLLWLDWMRLGEVWHQFLCAHWRYKVVGKIVNGILAWILHWLVKFASAINYWNDIFYSLGSTKCKLFINKKWCIVRVGMKLKWWNCDLQSNSYTPLNLVLNWICKKNYKII